MSGYENRLIGNLSGGQQQRIFIARALISEPELLLMDEPTVGVDAKSVRQIMDIISELNKQGMTIIMTNHDTPELVRVSDKLLIFCEHGHGEFVSRNDLYNATDKRNICRKEGASSWIIFFQYAFMQRAFVVAAIIAVIAPCIGVSIVLKRLSAIGDATSHSALAGVSHSDFARN